MKKLDPSEFLRDVLTQVDDLPPGFTEQIVSLVSSSQSSRAERIRKLISKVATPEVNNA